MATHTRNTLLKRGDGVSGASSVYTNVAAITSFTGPNETAPVVDVTTMDSTAREYITGLKDQGEITFELIFVGNNAQQQGIRTDLANGSARDWKLVLYDHATEASRTTLSFTGVVTQFAITGQIDDAWRGNVTIKLSGAGSWAYTA
jgi:predicted secreted protein